MPDKIYPRDGPMFRRRIFLETDQELVEGILVANHMNDVTIRGVPTGIRAPGIISWGRLRFLKSTDQGNATAVLTYIPNKKRFPNHERVTINQIVLT